VTAFPWHRSSYLTETPTTGQPYAVVACNVGNGWSFIAWHGTGAGARELGRFDKGADAKACCEAHAGDARRGKR
jgi:hypothetical protein